MMRQIPMTTRDEIIAALESDDLIIRAEAQAKFDTLEAAQGPIREAMRRYAADPSRSIQPSSAPPERLMRQMTGRAGATVFRPCVRL